MRCSTGHIYADLLSSPGVGLSAESAGRERRRASELPIQGAFRCSWPGQRHALADGRVRGSGRPFGSGRGEGPADAEHFEIAQDRLFATDKATHAIGCPRHDRRVAIDVVGEKRR